MADSWDEFEKAPAPAPAPAADPWAAFETAKPAPPKPSGSVLHPLSAPLKYVAGQGEALLGLGSRALAYPLSRAAAVGSYLSPWKRAEATREAGAVEEPPPGTPENPRDWKDENGRPITLADLPEADRQAILGAHSEQQGRIRSRRADDAAWQRAGEEGRAVEGLLSYEPRTPEGREILGTAGKVLGVATKPLQWAGQGLAALTDKVNVAQGIDPGLRERARDVANEAGTLGSGLLVGPLARGIPAARRAAAEGLRSYAEGAAVRALNADRTATKRVFGRPLNEAARHETGRYLLDEKIPIRSPAAAQEALGEALSVEGPEIGATVDAAAKAGARVDLGAATRAALSKLQGLKGNTEHRPIFERVERFLDDQTQQHGAQMDPVRAHQLRRDLDDLSAWDRTSSQVDKKAAGAFRDVRGALDDEITKAMEVAGLGKQWTAANASYKNASRAKQLADVGMERRLGNRIGSPSEKAAALIGGGALALHNPIAGVALPAATVALNRGWWPVTARASDALSRAVAPGAATSSVAAPAAVQASILAQAMRRYQDALGQPPALPGVGLSPAYGDEGADR